MKRFIIILLLLIHTAASSGTVLSMHYCMGSLASMHIGHKEESGCATCGMKNSGCCHDDVKVLKIDNSQFIAANTSHIQDHDQVLLNTSKRIYNTLKRFLGRFSKLN